MSILPEKMKLTVSPGILLLAALLFYLDDGIGMLPLAVAAAAIHELGHIAAALLFGGRIGGLALSAVGAELQFCYPSMLSYGKENAVALAGPAVNLLVGMTALLFRLYIPAAVSFGLGLFNLLPILPLDGGRVLFNVMAEYFGLDVAERVSAVAAGLLIGILAGFGLISVVKYANFMLLLVSAWLLINAVGKKMKIPQNK